MFKCYLCARAGRPSGPRHSSHSVICRDCAERIAAAGRKWCNRCKHIADEWDVSRHRCRACARAYTNGWQRARYADDPAFAAKKRAQDRARWPERRDADKLRVWRGR